MKDEAVYFSFTKLTLHTLEGSGLFALLLFLTGYCSPVKVLSVMCAVRSRIPADPWCRVQAPPRP